MDAGWYSTVEAHNPSNVNTFTGISEGYRSFYVFNVPNLVLGEEFVTATLSFNTYDISGSGNLELRNFGGSISSLVDGTGGTAAFADLGTGDLWGTFGFAAADAYQVRTITFTQLALDAFTSGQGGQIAFGGSSTSSYIFGYSDQPWPTLTFESASLSAVPEPSVLLPLSCMMGGALLLRGRRKQGSPVRKISTLIDPSA